MLHIAICDDVDNELRQISELTNQYLTEHNLSAEIREFGHPDSLLIACESSTFHIFLLDMVMPMVSGLELGRSIRQISTDAQIIYITTEPGFALDAYAVNPLHYLLKPVDKIALFSALELAVEKTHFGEESFVTIKTRSGLRTISVDDIACCEYTRHTAVYKLKNGESYNTTTLSESFAEHIVPLLRDRRFVQSHIAFVVNMSNVERLDKNGFTLRGGAFVPVSRKQFAAVRNTYLSYRLGEV